MEKPKKPYEWTPILPKQKDKKLGVCKCGHLQQEHKDSLNEYGHGRCTKCDCTRFTWVKFQ